MVWANPKCVDAIFLLVGLDVCFNFLNAIGQYTESAGLYDLWTQSGVYAVNITETMLNDNPTTVV